MKLLYKCVLFCSLGALLFAQDPPGAFGPLKNIGYSPKGDVITVDDLRLYVAERGIQGSKSKFVVWGHDIFGWESGRTQQLVDRLASETEYTVILPDLFRGVSLPPADSYEWESSLQFDWYNRIKPYLVDRGATSVGVVGTCWGSYFVIHTSVDTLVKAGFSTHPSHPGIMEGFGESEELQYQLVNDNAAAQYFCPTPQEGESVRPGGLADINLEQVIFEEFESPCNHGYFNRGNLSDPLVKECVERTFEHMKTFFVLHLY